MSIIHVKEPDAGVSGSLKSRQIRTSLHRCRSKRVVVVQDVSKDPRYLAGSSLVKSEMVVPIFVGNKLAAELDIESYFIDTFTKREQEFVEACGAVIANYLEKE
jgi:putative methionine-R-sulfoxide reductase with GAF domain